MGSLMRKLEDKLSGSSKHDEQGHTIDSHEAEHAQGLTGNHGHSTTGHSGVTDHTTTGNNNIGLAQSSSVRHPIGSAKNGSGITGGTALGSSNASDMPGSFPSNTTSHGLSSGTTPSNIERHSHVTSGPRTSTTTTTTGPHTTITTGNYGSSPLSRTHNATTGLSNVPGTHSQSSGLTGTASNVNRDGLSGTYTSSSPTTHSNTGSTGLTGTNHGLSNTTSSGLTGNNHGLSNTTSGGLTGNNHGLSNTTSGGLTGNNHGLTHSSSSGLTGNKHNTTTGGLTGNNHGLSHSSSGGLTGNNHNSTTGGLTGNNHHTTSGGLTGNNHGLSHSTSSNLTGNSHGVSNTTRHGRDERDFVGGAAPAGSALSSSHTGTGSDLNRDGYGNRTHDDRDDYVDNRTTMEKIKDKVVPSRTDRPDDPVTGQNFSQQSDTNNRRTSIYGSGPGAHDEYGSVQGGRGQYPGGERLRENDRNTPRDPFDPYSSRGQQTAADQRWGNDTYGASQNRREAGDLGSRSHDVDSPVRRSRDGGVTNGMSDLNLRSGPHPHLENPAAVPTAGGHKVGGVGEGSNVYNDSTGRHNDGIGRHDQHHYGRDAALAGGAGAAALGAGRHYNDDRDRDYERSNIGNNRRNTRDYDDRDDYVDNRSTMEKLKDKVVPGRVDRPDDPTTGRNINETNRNVYDNQRSSYDQDNSRHSLASPTSGHHPHTTVAAGPTGFGQNVSYMNRNQAETPLRGNPDLVDRYQEPSSERLGSGSHIGANHPQASHLGSSHNTGIHGTHGTHGTHFDNRDHTGAHLGSRDTTGAAATSSVLGHNNHNHNNQHHLGRDAALVGGAGALGAGAGHHYGQERRNDYDDRDRGLGSDNYNDRERGVLGSNNRRDDYDDRNRGIGLGSNTRRDEYDDDRSRGIGLGNNRRDHYDDNRTRGGVLGNNSRRDDYDDDRTGRHFGNRSGNTYTNRDDYNDNRTGTNLNNRSGNTFNDRDTYNDNRTGMEKMKDKILPGRADRPDDPVTGTNYSQQGYDNTRSGNNYDNSRTGLSGSNYDNSRTDNNYNDSRLGKGYNETRTGTGYNDTSRTGVHDNARGVGSGIGHDNTRGIGSGGHNSSSTTGLGHDNSSRSMSNFTTHNIDGKRIGGAYAAGYSQGWQDAVEHMQGLK